MKRVLLDEGVPKGLAKRLRDLGVDVAAFPNSWKQLTNGVLLKEIEREGFNILITNDKQMQFQQICRRGNWPLSCCRPISAHKCSPSFPKLLMP